MDSDDLLTVDDLHITFQSGGSTVHAVNGASFSVPRASTCALVGESGSGKSATAAAIMRVLPERTSAIAKGSIWFDGEDLARAPQSRMRQLRGQSIAMIRQDPMSSLNPVLTIGFQLAEAIRAHRDVSKRQARLRALELLELVEISDGARRLDEYPHQYSGGMRQRIMIAMALAAEPQLLVADEPTTALDVTIQAQILGLIKNLADSTGLSVLLITHDLGVVAEVADSVAVMYGGRIVESGSSETILTNARHPYSRALMAAIPRVDGGPQRLLSIAGSPPSLVEPVVGCSFADRCAFTVDGCRTAVPLLTAGDGAASGHLVACHRDAEIGHAALLRPAAGADPGPGNPRHTDDAAVRRDAVLEVDDLVIEYPIRRGLLPAVQLQAVRGVSLTLHEGETLALVGESGCGKTSVARAVLRLEKVAGGSMRIDGKEFARARGKSLRAVRRRLQMVFQDPYSVLNPRLPIGWSVAEPLRNFLGLSRRSAARRVEDLLARVGLNAAHARRLPHEFSGGQRQRIGIARALSPEPRVVVCDEALSALDVSVQAQIVNLLADLQESSGVAMLFISHDLGVVRHMSHRVAVMYLGRIVEEGPVEEVYTQPAHPYTKALISAVPSPAPDRRAFSTRDVLIGEIPSIRNPPPGCSFHTRCPLYRALGEPARCRTEHPELQELRTERSAACHFTEEASATH